MTTTTPQPIDTARTIVTPVIAHWRAQAEKEFGTAEGCKLLGVKPEAWIALGEKSKQIADLLEAMMERISRVECERDDARRNFGAALKVGADAQVALAKAVAAGVASASLAEEKVR